MLEGWCLPDHGLGSGQILSAFGTHPGIGTTSRVIALPAGGMPVTAELIATGSRGSGPAVPAGHRPGQRAQQPARSTCPEGGGPGRVDARRSPDDVSHADQGHREENEEESEHDESGGKTHRHPGPDRAPRVAISASSPTKADGERSNVVGVRPALGISMLSSDSGGGMDDWSFTELRPSRRSAGRRRWRPVETPGSPRGRTPGPGMNRSPLQA